MATSGDTTRPFFPLGRALKHTSPLGGHRTIRSDTIRRGTIQACPKLDCPKPDCPRLGRAPMRPAQSAMWVRPRRALG
jgi:hypothetical protein